MRLNGRACGMHGREVHNRVLMGKSEGKRSLGRPGVDERII
jgi:hypothetical protein